MNSNPRYIYAILIRSTPERIWHALTTTEILRPSWYGRFNTSSWQVGEPIESRSPSGELEWHGTILENQAPHRLSYTFHDLSSNEPPSRVTYEIEPLGKATMPQGEATMLRVIHEDFEPDSQVFHGISQGWPGILSSLKSYLETGSPIELGWREDASRPS